MDWKDLETRGATVFHGPTMIVGKVKKFWDGDAEKWRSTIDAQPVPVPVLELDTGHGLMAIDEAFVEMTTAHAKFYEALQQGLKGVVLVAATSCAPAGVEPEAALMLAKAALKAQLAALDGSR